MDEAFFCDAHGASGSGSP